MSREAVTSRFHLEFFWIDGLQAGRLATTTRPRGGEWLADDVRGLVHTRVRMLVSMLTDAENIELDLVAEGAAARAAKLEFLSIPIADRGLPERAAPFLDGVTRAASLVAAGESVVVHCRMGVGRSSMFAASTLVKLGVEPDDAWRLIAAVRGRPVPDVPTQREWVLTMVPAIRSHASRE